eukprot:1763643-Pyramimonas_sp.AAC.1
MARVRDCPEPSPSGGRRHGVGGGPCSPKAVNVSAAVAGGPRQEGRPRPPRSLLGFGRASRFPSRADAVLQ